MNRQVSTKPNSDNEIVQEMYKSGLTEEQIWAISRWIIFIINGGE
jgi:hypothetical protein